MDISGLRLLKANDTDFKMRYKFEFTETRIELRERIFVPNDMSDPIR